MGSDEVTFTNPAGSPTAEVELVTAAFRGFDPQNPDPDCADTSYWSRRYPTIISSASGGTLDGSSLTFEAGTSGSVSLGVFLPDNFPSPAGTKCSGATCPSRPASACDHYVLSLRVDLLIGGVPANVTVSCRNPAPPASFPEPLIATAGENELLERVSRDLAIATGILPRGNSVNLLNDCMGAAQGGDLSTAMVQNRSAARGYQGIYSGRFLCKGGNNSLVADNAVCKSGDPTSSTSGRGIRGMFRGFRVDADQCAAMRVNPALGFPFCCDCHDGVLDASCDSIVVVQCGRGVITGEKTSGGAQFALYEPFVFLDSHLDLEPRTRWDPPIAVESPAPNVDTLALTCGDFALSDIAGFTDVFLPFNDEGLRFDFDFSSVEHIENNACGSRKTIPFGDPNHPSIPFIGDLADVDQDGRFDLCQHLDVRRHRFSGSTGTTVRHTLRNRFYEGSGASASVPGLGVHDDLDFAGNIVAISTGQVENDSRYGQVLTFTTPGGLDIADEALEVVFSPESPEPLFLVDTFEGTDWLFSGVLEAGTGEGMLSGFSLVESAERDLLAADDGQVRLATPSGPVRAVAASDFGLQIFAGAGTSLHGYDAASGIEIDFDPGTSQPEPLELGWDVYGVAVEPDNAYAYVAAADPALSPGAGSFAVLDLNAQALVSGSSGNPLIGSIRGTPIALAVRNIGAAGSRKAIAYVTSVELDPNICTGGGGGGGGGGDHEIVPLGGATGGTTNRGVLVSAFNLDRPNFTGATELSQIALSCETGVSEELIEDVGLATSASGQVFVVSPVTQELRVFNTGPTIGKLSVAGSVSLGFTPTDVDVAPGPSGAEIAVVVGYDPSTGAGRAVVFNNTSNLADRDAVDLEQASVGVLVSTAIRFDGKLAYIAGPSSSEIRAINVTAFPPALDPLTVLEAAGTIRRLSVQRRLP